MTTTIIPDFFLRVFLSNKIRHFTAGRGVITIPADIYLTPEWFKELLVDGVLKRLQLLAAHQIRKVQHLTSIRYIELNTILVP